MSSNHSKFAAVPLDVRNGCAFSSDLAIKIGAMPTDWRGDQCLAPTSFNLRQNQGAARTPVESVPASHRLAAHQAAKPKRSDNVFACLLMLCCLVLVIHAQSELSNFKLTPPIAPPIGSISTVRDACANWWTLALAENKQRKLLVLPAQAPTAWADPSIKGVTTDHWQRLVADDRGYVWLIGKRSLVFDPRKPEVGALDTARTNFVSNPNWIAKTRLPISNHDLTAAALNGKFYVAGGLTADYGFPARSHPFDELWELNPNTWSWRVAAKLFRARIYCATAAFDNKIWVIGGDVIEPDGKRFAVTTVEMIDPRTGQVTRGLDSTLARPMPLALEANGRLYVMGNPREQYEQPGRMESIGKGEAAWRPEPDGPAGMGPLAGASLNDKLYVIVPKKGLAIFDAKVSRWDLIVPPGGVPRSCQMAAYRGEIWMLGGQDIEDPEQSLIFHPRTKQFRRGPPLPRPNSWGAAATVNGKLIVTGGAALRSPSDRIYIYNDQTFVLRENSKR
jgi:N-acetylneuraminic acid mutarotase